MDTSGVEVRLQTRPTLLQEFEDEPPPVAYPA